MPWLAHSQPPALLSDPEGALATGRDRRGAGLLPYLRIARIDHWVKNAFMLPGTALALLFVRPPIDVLLWQTLLGLASLCLCSSANYTINEFLDGEFDRFHPIKNKRPGAQGLLDARFVALQYAALASVAVGLAATVGRTFAITCIALLMMGIVYNARPFRTKDWQYLDVLSEAINNPLRLLLGWFALVHDVLPPSSIILAYWMGGAFLMAVKRYTELRGIADHDAAGRYRRSFIYYTEDKLLLSAFFYAVCSSFFLGVFLIKYRIEFLLTFPLFSLMFTWYFAIGLKPNSAAQAPERLFTERRFLTFVGLICAAVAVLFYLDIPILHILVEPISVR
jgi:decaprenyl-phosphate phosphoribosyltransferase